MKNTIISEIQDDIISASDAIQ